MTVIMTDTGTLPGRTRLPCSVICRFAVTSSEAISQGPLSRTGHPGLFQPNRVVEPLKLPRNRVPIELPLAETPPTLSHCSSGIKWLTHNFDHSRKEGVYVGRSDDTSTRRSHQRPYVDLV